MKTQVRILKTYMKPGIATLLCNPNARMWKTGKFLEAHGPVSLVCTAINVKEILFYYTQGWTLITTCTVAHAYIPMCEHTHEHTYRFKKSRCRLIPLLNLKDLHLHCRHSGTYRRKISPYIWRTVPWTSKITGLFKVATMFRTQWQNENKEMLW